MEATGSRSVAMWRMSSPDNIARRRPANLEAVVVGGRKVYDIDIDGEPEALPNTT
jgi:hypothetical protein